MGKLKAKFEAWVRDVYGVDLSKYRDAKRPDRYALAIWNIVWNAYAKGYKEGTQ